MPASRLSRRAAATERQRRWREANPEKARERQIRRRWGITVEEYDEIISRGCAICGTHKGRTHLDHDHATGRIRDALCTKCNTGLGLFEDDPDRLAAAIDYVRLHSARQSP